MGPIVGLVRTIVMAIDYDHDGES